MDKRDKDMWDNLSILIDKIPITKRRILMPWIQTTK